MPTVVKQIPAGWNAKVLSEICDILIGGTPSRNKPEYWDKDKENTNVWISIRDLSNSGKYISDSSEYISDQGAKSSNVKPIPKGNVLMSFKLTIGRTAITDREVYTNEAIAAFLVKDGSLLDANFLYYALPGLQYDTDTAIKGATLNKEKLKTTKIVLPSLPEQTKIATILSKVDEEIEKVERIIGQTEKLKKGLMQKLLTKGIGHTKFKQSELGEIPAGWEVKSGESISTLITKGASPKWQGFDYQSEGTLFVTSENVRDGYLDISIKKFLTLEFHAKLKHSQLNKNDILINIVGASIGRSCIFDAVVESANINQAVCLLRVKPDINPNFLIQYLQMQGTIDRLLDSQSGSARQNLSLADIRNFPFIVPPLNEQIEIEKILMSIDYKNVLNQDFLNKLSQLKKGLMADLLSGKVRTKI